MPLYLQLNDSSYLVHLGKFVSHRLLEYGVYQRILKQKMDSLTDLSTPAQFQSELPGQFKSQKAAQFHRNNQWLIPPSKKSLARKVEKAMVALSKKRV